MKSLSFIFTRAMCCGSLVVAIFASSANELEIPPDFKETVRVDLTDLELVSTRRISRFVFEYQYEPILTNSDETIDSGIVIFASTNPMVDLQNPNIELEKLTRELSAKMPLVLRHDRRSRFSLNQIVATFLIPDPTSDWPTVSTFQEKVRLASPPGLIVSESRFRAVFDDEPGLPEVPLPAKIDAFLIPQTLLQVAALVEGRLDASTIKVENVIADGVSSLHIKGLLIKDLLYGSSVRGFYLVPLSNGNTLQLQYDADDALAKLYVAQQIEGLEVR
jgi:hypothetical protein